MLELLKFHQKRNEKRIKIKQSSSLNPSVRNFNSQTSDILRVHDQSQSSIGLGSRSSQRNNISVEVGKKRQADQKLRMKNMVYQ